MPFLPRIVPGQTSQDMTDTFLGYNHNLKIGPGEFYDTQNLTTAHYPLLANRAARGTYKTLTNGQGLVEKNALIWVDNGTLYFNGEATGVTGLSAGDKQLVSMGAYVVIFPDKKFFNTADLTFGNLGASFSSPDGSTVAYYPCKVDGSLYTIDVTSDAEPSDPSDGMIWRDTTTNSLKTYSASLMSWTSIETVYTRIQFSSHNQVPAAFKEHDGVTITGAVFPDLNGEKIIYAVGGDNDTDDYIVVVGLTDSATDTGTVTITRSVPDMDYVCECQNRLWGCKYGLVNGVNVNEIYCSALGDFRNWSQYLGLSTDSWRASVGSDGEWTGAVNYLGSPVFFKENHLHQITVSGTGAHRIDEMTCRGVQAGSGKSLQVINETLYYKSRTDVVSWQGGFPVGVSNALGDIKYYNAVAGVFGQRYYISMNTKPDNSGEWHLFTYDHERNIWMHEDNLHAEAFAKVADELFCIADNKILALNGTMGDAEEGPDWKADTGVLYYAYANKKYVSRFNIRLKMESGAEMHVYLEYDSSGVWVPAGTVKIGDHTGTMTLPVRPRRCDHCRIRLMGNGNVRIYSIAKILEVGSDV